MPNEPIVSDVLSFLRENLLHAEIKSIIEIGAGMGWLAYWLRLFWFEEPFNPRSFNNQLDAIEIYEPYTYCLKKQYYSNVFQKDVLQDIPKGYDLVIGIEVLEHIEKDAAIDLVRQLQEKNRYLFFTTTNGYRKQGIFQGNKYQIHRCGFSRKDFTKLGLETKVIDKSYLFVYSKGLIWHINPLYIKIRRKIPLEYRRKLKRIRGSNNVDK